MIQFEYNNDKKIQIIQFEYNNDIKKEIFGICRRKKN